MQVIIEGGLGEFPVTLDSCRNTADNGKGLHGLGNDGLCHDEGTVSHGDVSQYGATFLYDDAIAHFGVSIPRFLARAAQRDAF